MPGFEPYLPATSLPGGSLEFGEQPAGDTAAADAGHHVHPFDLGHPLPRLGEDPHPAAPDGLTREVDDEKPPVRRRELRRVDGGRVRSAVAGHVLLLHQRHEHPPARAVVGLLKESQVRDPARHRQPWSTGPMPAPSPYPAAMAPLT